MSETSLKSTRPKVKDLYPSAKLPKSLANLELPLRAYSTHPRVQKAFRRLVNSAKREEHDKRLALNSHEEIVPPEEPE
jgi:hypothetical protein